MSECNSYEYELMIDSLRNMGTENLIELFHDIEDIGQVEFIGNCALSFVWNSRMNRKELSQDEDAHQVDDARRARELKE